MDHNTRRRPAPEANYRGTYSRRRRKHFNPIPFILLILLVLAAVGMIAKLVSLGKEKKGGKPADPDTAITETLPSEEEETEPESQPAAQESIADQARLMYLQYDYDGAMELINSDPLYAGTDEGKQLLSDCETAKAACVEFDLKAIPHVFFHILAYDTDLAFDGDTKQDGYNQVMTTTDEFMKMMDQMYERGFVLVSLHDMATEEIQADGSYKMVPGKIMLPEGKTAFVMSQDDVCYYEYMKGDGFATKMIVGEDGRPVNEYIEKDGTVSVGAYDLVPLLDQFIDEHPDFSYHGHKAAICFTGYNGVLGYRTDESYDPSSQYYDPKLEDSPNNNLEADRAAAVEVMKAMVADGYDLASHSWGHRDMGAISVSHFKTDCDRWDRNVNSLIREATGKDCDILIYPKGADIGSWQPYDSSKQTKENCMEKFKYFTSLGFRFFCNVDSNQPWNQISDKFIRQGRINLDGDRMWRDMQNPDKAKLTQFIDVNTCFDWRRPTPVPGY